MQLCSYRAAHPVSLHKEDLSVTTVNIKFNTDSYFIKKNLPSKLSKFMEPSSRMPQLFSH